VSPQASARPLTLGIVKNGDDTVTVTFQGTPGAQYVVQASGSLGYPANWVDISTNTAGQNGLWSITESVTNHPVRFYRCGPADVSVALRVVAPNTLRLQKNTNSTVTVYFSGTPTAQYLVQASSSLGTSANWTNISTNSAGADGLWNITEAIGGHTQRFYRSAMP